MMEVTDTPIPVNPVKMVLHNTPINSKCGVVKSSAKLSSKARKVGKRTLKQVWKYAFIMTWKAIKRQFWRLLNMVKCDECIEGDPKFGYEFRNNLMLETHKRAKHKKAEKKVQPEDESDSGSEDESDSGSEELTLNDIGLGDGAKNQELKGLRCSECGAELSGDEERCPVCDEVFE